MRESGILMPVSSLPGPYGIGCFGKEAFKFVDFLAQAGQKIWQILPLSPTGYGDSPYQSCSAFAGNPYFIDLDALKEEGLLTAAQLKAEKWGTDPKEVDYGTLYVSRFKVLRTAYAAWRKQCAGLHGCSYYFPDDYYAFTLANEEWLDDYALYMALKAANGMKKNQMGKPIIAIVNSFTQFVPGHVHLHEIGQLVKAEIEKLGCFAAEFNTIAIDDGIAMGHDGMLYSLPSRDIIADSVEYMVNAHKADAMVCISNCDKITPGMLMAAMRLNIPPVFVSGGPMEAGEWNGQHLDLIDAMIKSADDSVSDQEVANIEQNACPTCGCCSGMFLSLIHISEPTRPY